MAAFDVDGTLTHRDSLHSFLTRLGTRRQVAAAVVTSSTALVTRSRAVPWRGAVKEALLGRLVAGRPVGDIERVGEAYASALLAALRPDTLGRLRWHQELGHQVVLVSASPAVYLRPLARALQGVDGVLATELEVDPAGCYTGRFDGPNCRGPEKVRRLQEWLGDRRPELWAYGDSAGDAELLAMADVPHQVRKVDLPREPDRGSR